MIARLQRAARTTAIGPLFFGLPALGLALYGCAANDGVRFQVISMERPPEGLGLPPPPDYKPCYWGEARGYDRTGDGKVDEVRISFKGRERCYGEDANHDGIIDTWDLMDENGHLVRRAHDANGDGRVDQSWTFDPSRRGCATIAPDVDGDGAADPGSLIDICQQLAPQSTRPQALPRAAAPAAPTPNR